MLRKLQEQAERISKVTGLSVEELLQLALSGKSADEVVEIAKQKKVKDFFKEMPKPVADTCGCEDCKNGNISGMAIRHEGRGKMIDGVMKLEMTTTVITNQKEYTNVLVSANMSQEMQQELCSTNILRIFSRNKELAPYKSLVIGKMLEEGEF